MNDPFTLKDGREVDIIIQDSLEEITVENSEGDEVGSIELTCVNDEDFIYKITRMYLDKLDTSYLRQGIGRECLRRYCSNTGHIVFAEDDDGIPKNDGSHLTGHAPPFVDKMNKEKILGHAHESSEIECPDPQAGIIDKFFEYED